MAPRSLSENVEERTERFRRKFLMVLAVLEFVTNLSASASFLFLAHSGFMALLVATPAALAVVTWRLARVWRLREAALVFLYGNSTALFLATFFAPQELLAVAPNVTDAGMYAGLIWLMFSGFLLGSSGPVRLGAYQLLCVALATGARFGDVEYGALSSANGALLMLNTLLTAVGVWLIYQHAEENLELLVERDEAINTVVQSAEAIATGDLGVVVAGDSDVSVVIRGMLVGLRQLVEQVRTASAEVSAATRQLTAMASTQEAGAVQQASAVKQTRASLHEISRSSVRIARAASGLAEGADTALVGSRQAGEDMTALTDQTRRISLLLGEITAIANKSEVLALNAALEGTRAGAAGMGFTHIAGEMQVLAERVKATVHDINVLNKDVAQATESTERSVHAATDVTESAARSARQISEIAMEQQRDTTRLDTAMESILNVSDRSLRSSQGLTAAGTHLEDLAARMHELMKNFRV